VSVHYPVKNQYPKTSENPKHESLSTINHRCGGLFSNHFTMDLLLSFRVKELLTFVNIWRSYRQEGCFTHALCAWALSCIKMKNLPWILVQYE